MRYNMKFSEIFGNFKYIIMTKRDFHKKYDIKINNKYVYFKYEYIKDFMLIKVQ